METKEILEIFFAVASRGGRWTGLFLRGWRRMWWVGYLHGWPWRMRGMGVFSWIAGSYRLVLEWLKFRVDLLESVWSWALFESWKGDNGPNLTLPGDFGGSILASDENFRLELEKYRLSCGSSVTVFSLELVALVMFCNVSFFCFFLYDCIRWN
jgi:hypothetical protein